MVTLTQTKDASLTIRLVDKNGEAVDITDWTSIKARLIFSWGVILEKFAPLTTSVNEIQKIVFSAIPDAGTWTVTLNGNITTGLAFNADAAALQIALNLLEGISGLTVVGDYAAGFSCTFAGGTAARNWDFMIVTDTLTESSNPVDVTITEETKGVPRSGVDVIFVHPAKLKIFLSEDDLASLQDGTVDLDLHIRVADDDLQIPVHKKAAKTEAIS